MLLSINKKCLFQIALIALVSFITGRLGHLISLPPGIASLVWAPFGLGLSGLLLFGKNRWPGIFLGALFVNYELLTWDKWFVNIGIAFGTSLALVAAAVLIEKKLKYPKSFFNEKEILWFLIIAGPMSAIINATFGVGSLYIGKLVSAEMIIKNFLYWWTGDSIGAFVFAPLALIFAQKEKGQWRRSTIKITVPLIIFFIIMIGALKFFNDVQTDTAVLEFQKQAQFIDNIIDSEARDFEAQVSSLFYLFENSQTMDQEKFRNISKSLFDVQAESLGTLWIPWNPQRPNEFYLKYFESRKNNFDLVGKKIAFDSAFQKKLENFVNLDKALMSQIKNVNELGLPEFSIVLARYSQKHHGLVACIISLSAINDMILHNYADTSLRFTISEQSHQGGDLVIYDSLSSSAFKDKFKMTPIFFFHDVLTLGDKDFLLQFSQDSNIRFANVSTYNIFLFMALLLTYITCALMTITFTRFLTVEELVEEKVLTLKDVNLQLESASRAKSEFLSNMSHEIRTPLNILIGTTDLLDDASLNDEKRHYLKVAKKAGESLLIIINDILDLSKIEAGSVKLENVDVDLTEIVKTTCEMFSIETTRKNLKFTTELDLDIQNIYLGDPMRIRQILFNLISNAVKFTNQGFIHLKVTTNSDNIIPGNIRFEVQDTGIGIPADKLKLLFHPFAQADTTITRKYGGSGLGLIISKRLAEMMNGSIQVQSIENKGSTFTFTLELPFVRKKDFAAEPLNEPTDLHAKTETPQLTILIVDDAEDNRSLLKAYLKKTSHKIIEAENGEEAINLFKQYHPDLIFMDMQMPVMDGLTATKKIRNWENENDLPAAQIWALTAYALTEEIKKSLDAGCDLHLTKPIMRAQFLQHIKDFEQKVMDKHRV